MLLLLIKVQTNFLQALHRTALTWLKNKNEQQISSTQANHIAEANLASPKAVTKQKAEVCVCVSNRVCEYDRDWVAVCWAAGQKNRWSHPRESKLQSLRESDCWHAGVGTLIPECRQWWTAGEQMGRQVWSAKTAWNEPCLSSGQTVQQNRGSSTKGISLQ